MKSIQWNDEWKYWIDRDSFALVWSVPEDARTVTLPHDAMLEGAAHKDSPNGNNTGYRDGDIYTYVKHLYVPEDGKGKTYKLKFEGVYMNAFVYVNEQLAAKSPFGYSTFYVDLDTFLRYGADNEIRVQVRCGAMTNSRWYSGGGIYRDVYLLEGPKAYICPGSVKISTESADEAYGVLAVSAALKNREPLTKDLILETRLEDPLGNCSATDRVRVILTEGGERSISRRIAVPCPKLWDEAHPDMYVCRMRLYDRSAGEDLLLDTDTESFGIRTLALDARRGLRINGRAVKLRGACIHHDSGLLGAATYEDAQYRQIRRLKEAGFNAVRMSHNPMAPAMLRACDRLGMYVMDEAFDMWSRLKSGYDYGLYFQEWWEKDLTALVEKDFNHPSVIMYSVGNEIPEIGTDHGSALCHDLCGKVRQLDHTRYVTACINGVFAAGDAIGKIMGDILSKADGEEPQGNVNNFMTVMDAHMDEIVRHGEISERLEKACAPLDVAGYNYMASRYEDDKKAYPNRIIVGSETYPPDIAKNWALVKALPHVIGDFTWTGWDYIGEAGVGIPGYTMGEGGFGAVFPAQLAYCGDFDLIGNRRPASYFREAVFGLSNTPYIAVQNPRHYGEQLLRTPWMISDATASWTWPGWEGKPVIVEVYAPGKEVELLLNGKSLGKKPSGAAGGFRTLFETVYTPGELIAVVYDSGKEMGRHSLETTGPVHHLEMKPETPGESLCYIALDLKDAKGRLVTNDDRELSVCVTGAARLLGFGSGNPKPAHNYNGNVTNTYLGRAQLILKKRGNGPVHVSIYHNRELAAELDCCF